MKRYINNLLLIIVLSVPIATYAQGFEDEEDVEDQVPLDGGLSLLAIGGIAYGAKKWHAVTNKRSKY